MTEQLALDFSEPRRLLPDRLDVILRWDEALEMVTSEWPDLGLTCSFRDWHVALDLVLRPVGLPLRTRIRVRV